MSAMKKNPRDVPVDYPTVAIDFEALAAVEQSCRRRLQDDPCDTQARVSLAWCLFVQALHQAGQESVLARLTAEGQDVLHPPAPVTAALEREAAVLLTESLEQTYRVKQLGTSTTDRREASHLQAVARLAVGEAAVAQTAAAAEESVFRLVQALLGTEEPPLPPGV